MPEPETLTRLKHDVRQPLESDDSFARLAYLKQRYREVRAFTESLCEPLATEDYVVQTMTDVSPTKWHLAHTTWFFEQFVLQEFSPGYRPLHPAYAYLFNSYYVQAGERHCRDRRGYLSRPTVSEVFDYRHHVDCCMAEFLAAPGEEAAMRMVSVLELGLHHEQQHQELILTDIKHVLSVNPLRPAYREVPQKTSRETPELNWIHFEEGLYEVGHEGRGFAYDNEGPRHRVYLRDFLLSRRLVTNAEYVAFIEDGGYDRPELWLSDGWTAVEEHEWSEPFYWENRNGDWHAFTLGGMQPIALEEPVCHLSFYEADAFARWAGARLPTEHEWEIAARTVEIQGNFVEDGLLHPSPASRTSIAVGQREPADAQEGLQQIYGDVWEWTRSAYSPYPGYSPPPGALGEYNGKFMSNQYVLRGGSCATSITHIRPTYRNFFYPTSTWQFTGLRLARDV